mmetsp:Transcript_15567/g.33647  ORF Transcript_15567/g.33647 Transcript_15567/m.33647 type:complete len:84 (+) Transcript_15567:58-309(+)
MIFLHVDVGRMKKATLKARVYTPHMEIVLLFNGRSKGDGIRRGDEARDNKLHHRHGFVRKDYCMPIGVHKRRTDRRRELSNVE